MKIQADKLELSKEEEIRLLKLSRKTPSHFKGLYDFYFEPIFYFILKRVENDAFADDLTSKVFLKALQNLGKYEDKGFRFSSWLHAIALNEIRQFYRTNKSAVKQVSVSSEDLESIPVETNQPEDQRMDLLIKGLEQLDDDDILLIELKYFEHHSYREIASMLRLTETNAKVKTHRALNELKKLVRNEA